MFDGQPKEIIIYATADGAQPFAEWRKRLREPEALARINKRVDRLRRGNSGDYKIFGDICELRIDYGPRLSALSCFCRSTNCAIAMRRRQKHAERRFQAGAEVLARLSREA